ncbi:GDP-mannose 4,6-dehydratase, partial [bacterium]|nr:GDP-mannose 4,6-dehydratase [bacterium]
VHKSIGEVINIGSNFEISIESLVRKISSLIGKKLKITFDKKRIRPKKSEVGRLIANNSKAKELVNWSPKVTIDEGLKKTIKWIEKNIKLYKTNIYNI